MSGLSTHTLHLQRHLFQRQSRWETCESERVQKGVLPSHVWSACSHHQSVMHPSAV